ncbi:MAG: 16S rRNA processing protein RimM [Desulfobacteraceae bacterium 4484_190.2]|nr:MAG: 16S rRNA processing protein RimM [Desulfobacteraceae bacterium 4484_190.2]
MPRASSGSLLLVGKVIGPHGLGGLLRIWAYARSEASFLDAETVMLRSVSGETHEYTVTYIRPHKNFFLMRLDGLSAVGEAAEYRGADIFVNKEAVARSDDEYFWYELLGLKVYLDTGQYVGTISEIIPTKAHDIYVVKEGDKEVCIPAIYEVVKEIDIANKKMVISALEGLLELNEV